ncbi:hypothetical protein E2C01_042804 [Portunus trituberculatus]|uniref:Uncharacterized protein n=1 Tax=Portunus trituberculatus TaxID=210409 RepID=A0A5B7FTZ4_PORTR|nr:hypothetical protein [Portunus trituberculatus]
MQVFSEVSRLFKMGICLDTGVFCAEGLAVLHEFVGSGGTLPVRGHEPECKSGELLLLLLVEAPRSVRNLGRRPFVPRDALLLP